MEAVDLSGADLYAAKLHKLAMRDGATFASLDLAGSSSMAHSLYVARPLCAGAALGARLESADLSEFRADAVDMSGASFDGADLTDATFHEAPRAHRAEQVTTHSDAVPSAVDRLRGCHSSRALQVNLDGATFAGANVADATFTSLLGREVAGRQQPLLEPLPEGRIEVVAPGGQTGCEAEGEEYRFFVRGGNPHRLLLHFDGGGACWSYSSCGTGATHDPVADFGLARGRSGERLKSAHQIEEAGRDGTLQGTLHRMPPHAIAHAIACAQRRAAGAHSMALAHAPSMRPPSRRQA
jgi:hypothetical protein